MSLLLSNDRNTDVIKVGGSSLEEDGRYVLGDDALACLKDILRWIRLHDDRLKRYDVQRCIAESNLVEGDLLEILAQSPADAALEKLRHRVALACSMLAGSYARRCLTPYS